MEVFWLVLGSLFSFAAVLLIFDIIPDVVVWTVRKWNARNRQNRLHHRIRRYFRFWRIRMEFALRGEFVFRDSKDAMSLYEERYGFDPYSPFVSRRRRNDGT